MGFRTRVRLPPGPLDGVLAEPQLKKCEITLYENVFGVRFFSDEDSIRTKEIQSEKLTFSTIQKWIADTYGVKVCKSSITMVKDKCNIDKIGYKAGTIPEPGVVKTNKEKAVLEAFKALEIV